SSSYVSLLIYRLGEDKRYVNSSRRSLRRSKKSHRPINRGVLFLSSLVDWLKPMGQEAGTANYSSKTRQRENRYESCGRPARTWRGRRSERLGDHCSTNPRVEF